MGRISTEEPANRVAPLSTSVSRRAFLAGAAACAVAGPALLRAAVHEPGRQILLHVTTRALRDGHVHTFALTSNDCRLLGSTAIDSLATVARHPALPVLYVARDCPQWEDLPRGVIETYAVEAGVRPLRLLAQRPMALSATGLRSLAVSSCGRHLLVSASTGGAWNAFTLNNDGLPASVATARKETGTMLNLNTVSLPTPHGLVFSPHAPVALGVDPGSELITLLRPSPEGIGVLARCQAPYKLSTSRPVWTADGRYVIVANTRSASLSTYETHSVAMDGSAAGIRLLGTTLTATPITALLAHPLEAAVFASRPDRSGSRLELWKVRGSALRLASDTWVPARVVALAQHGSSLWIAAQDRLIQLPVTDLHGVDRFELPLPMHGLQAIVIQNVGDEFSQDRGRISREHGRQRIS